MKIPFLMVGILLMVYGIFLWAMANFHSHIDKGIETNTRMTTGVYGLVRNPIYSGFMFACTGALFILWLLLLPPVFWLYMMLLMRAAEEKPAALFNFCMEWKEGIVLRSQMLYNINKFTGVNLLLRAGLLLAVFPG